MKKRILKINKAYAFKDFKKGEYEIKINGATLYGENKTRNDLKIVEVNDFLLHNVSKIIVESDDFVVFKFLNAEGEIVGEHMLSTCESLIVKTTPLGALEYNFEVIAS